MLIYYCFIALDLAVRSDLLFGIVVVDVLI